MLSLLTIHSLNSLSPTTAGLNCVCVWKIRFSAFTKTERDGGGGKKGKKKDFHSRNRERAEPRPFSILYALENMRETLLDAPNFPFFLFCNMCTCVSSVVFSMCFGERREKIQRTGMTCARLSEFCSYIRFSSNIVSIRHATSLYFLRDYKQAQQYPCVVSTSIPLVFFWFEVM